MLLQYQYILGSRRNEFVSSRASGANTDGLPAGVLYQVKASYRYQAEDVDELNFDVGEVINVVEYDDPEDQVRETKSLLV